MSEKGQKNKLYEITLKVVLYGADQADALGVLTNAINEKCGRETEYVATIEESNIKNAKNSSRGFKS